MRNRALSLSLPLAAAALLLAQLASAVTIDSVAVGDPGNANDSQVMVDGTTGYGSVGYAYYISKYEVTNAQYSEFLNAVADADPNGLYPVGPTGIIQAGDDGSYTYSLVAGLENTPVEGVSFWDAARFANWMHNGQPVGPQGNSTTENGAYTLTPQGIAANSITRNVDASIFLPSENEWYKAAYYDAVSTSFFDYPAGTDAQTVCAAPGATPNTANCNNAVGTPTSVGAYTGSASPYGTFDQGGNTFEWTETIHQDDSGLYRVKRGGAWQNNIFSTPENLSASVRYGVLSGFEATGSGFRLASPIPEPSTGLLVMTGLLGLAYRQRGYARAGRKTNEPDARRGEAGRSWAMVLACLAALGAGTARAVTVNPVLASAVAVGGNTACALTLGGGVQCWGESDEGQLGNGTTSWDGSSVPGAVSGLSSGVTAIAVGSDHSCAVTAGGGVQCWGANNYGQLGDGTTTNSSIPVAVTGLSSGVAGIATGGRHSCALTAGGSVRCWGRNTWGQLGDGTTTNSSIPVAVTGLPGGVIAISTRERHTCALTEGGGVQCWGHNAHGQLGNGTTTDSSIPVAVTGLSSGVEAVTAGSQHTCAIIAGGGVQCWGWNDHGQLGDGTTTDSSIPVAVTGLSSGVEAVTAGTFHSCVFTVGGVDRKCWGANDSGELGDGTTASSSIPVAVIADWISISIATGSSNTCDVNMNARVRCWGNNAGGQLGSNVVTSSSVPVVVFSFLDETDEEVYYVPALGVPSLGVLAAALALVAVRSGQRMMLHRER